MGIVAPRYSDPEEKASMSSQSSFSDENDFEETAEPSINQEIFNSNGFANDDFIWIKSVYIK